MPGQEGFGGSSDSFIVINGGEFVIVSSGDCIDSNGSLTINGGTIDLTCNGAGDTTLDCDGTYTNKAVLSPPTTARKTIPVRWVGSLGAWVAAPAVWAAVPAV